MGHLRGRRKKSTVESSIEKKKIPTRQPDWAKTIRRDNSIIKPAITLVHLAMSRVHNSFSRSPCLGYLSDYRVIFPDDGRLNSDRRSHNQKDQSEIGSGRWINQPDPIDRFGPRFDIPWFGSWKCSSAKTLTLRNVLFCFVLFYLWY